MTQDERLLFLISQLVNENEEYKDLKIPQNNDDRKKMLRSLMNIRYASPVSDDFLKVQDEYLTEELSKKGIVDIADLQPVENGIYIWRGDITRLKCGAIVNAANSVMTGCYQPCHSCIDNCIHTFSGIQLRNYCDSIMQKQGFPEPTGKAKLTPAFNLPCDYVIHTVGPIVQDSLTKRHCDLLKSCYTSCLEVAVQNNIKSIAFCCISTGVFHFPNDKAAQIAVQTVRDFKQKNKNEIEVIFNVFTEYDEQIYTKLF